MNQAVIQALKQRALRQVRQRANQGQSKALQLHQSVAPGTSQRGGAPAVASGNLLRLIKDGYQELPDGASIVQNYAVLEFGPLDRPLARLTNEALLNDT